MDWAYPSSDLCHLRKPRKFVLSQAIIDFLFSNSCVLDRKALQRVIHAAEGCWSALCKTSTAGAERSKSSKAHPSTPTVCFTFWNQADALYFRQKHRESVSTTYKEPWNLILAVVLYHRIRFLMDCSCSALSFYYFVTFCKLLKLICVLNYTHLDSQPAFLTLNANISLKVAFNVEHAYKPVNWGHINIRGNYSLEGQFITYMQIFKSHIW